MGREAEVLVEVDRQSAVAKVLLESHELIIRGTLRRKIPLSGIRGISVRGDCLRFNAGDTRIALHLGNAIAEKWAKAMLRPAPGLADKLGITPQSKVFLICGSTDAAVQEILSGHTTRSLVVADVLLAHVASAADVAKAMSAARRREELHLWLVYGKGAKAAFGDASVRTQMREAGFVDSKSCAVSATLTATRYRAAPRR